MLTHDDLVVIARKWLSAQWRSGAPEGHSGCPVIISELTTCSAWGEIPDAIGYSSSKEMTILVECKTSRSDFRADLKKPFRMQIMPEAGLGDQRWYLSESGIIPIDELPPRWGLIEIQESGKAKVVRPCERFEVKNYRSEINLLLSAMCRLKVNSDDHIGIRVYHELAGMSPSKKRAALDIIEDEE